MLVGTTKKRTNKEEWLEKSYSGGTAIYYGSLSGAIARLAAAQPLGKKYLTGLRTVHSEMLTTFPCDIDISYAPLI